MELCFISHICRLRPCKLFVKIEAVGLSDLKTTTPQQPKSEEMLGYTNAVALFTKLVLKLLKVSCNVDKKQ